MDEFTFGKAARDELGNGAVLFDVLDFQFGDDVFAAFDFKVSIGKNATAVAFVQNPKTPLREILRNASGEFWIDDSFTSTGFGIPKFRSLSDDVFEFSFG